MNPIIVSKIADERLNILRFTISGINVSLINAIRRTVLSDIPTVVFKTTPYEESKATILVNTTRLNNEILKQRLSCIPIHITDLDMPLQDYLLEVNEENKTDTIKYITTEHFKIKNVNTNTYLSDETVRTIFPSNSITGYFIDFARLRPNISESLPGEKLQLTCQFSINSVKEDSSFNVVSICAYGNTVDSFKAEEELEKITQKWRDEKMSADTITLKRQDWKLLEGTRLFIPDSFDFIIQTVGVFTNEDILIKACQILVAKLKELTTIIETNELEVNPSENTMQHSFDIILKDEDYTIGKVLEYLLYTKYYHGEKTLTFCGFSKMHPHDTDSIIRVAYKDNVSVANILQNLLVVVGDAITIYEHIQKMF
jgi:DNA-directed RNA polymerase alpha subunit